MQPTPTNYRGSKPRKRSKRSGPASGAVFDLPTFRAQAAAAALTKAQRRLLVDQAQILIEDIYVHLPLKRAMHAVDPVQRLRLLRHRLDRIEDRAFHDELADIFLDLRDLHTNYILPNPYRSMQASLGFLLEQYWENDEPHFLVSKMRPGLVSDTRFKPGVEITHWNGMPIDLAVERNAELEAGSNPPARRVRGIERLTYRPLALSLPPDEDWVVLTYISETGVVREVKVPWKVSAPDPVPDPGGSGTGKSSTGPLRSLDVPTRQLVGLDLRAHLARGAKKQLFAPAALKEEKRVSGKGTAPRATAAQKAVGIVPTTRPDEITARTVTTPSGTFGHLRLWTFSMADENIGAFLNEVIRLIGILPQNGLILDVRGNGGGYIVAGEFLLQLFTPNSIEPERMHFINTPTTQTIARDVNGLSEWAQSIGEATETGAQYSKGFALYPVSLMNGVGQLYHGPVVLITDALCYSTTDIFAAGFQDHEIGTVLGVDANTGAGGANVWTHDYLRQEWPAGPLQALPKGAGFRVSFRRSTRVGQNAGQPVEDLGVVPDIIHRTTRDDLLHGNRDLIAKAGEILSGEIVRRLAVGVASRQGKDVTLNAQTVGVRRLDVYADSRPVSTLDIGDGSRQIDVRMAKATGGVIALKGFDGGQLVAARRLEL